MTAPRSSPGTEHTPLLGNEHTPLLGPDFVLQQARELLEFYESHEPPKPYTFGVLADCIEMIERLRAESTSLREANNTFADHAIHGPAQGPLDAIQFVAILEVLEECSDYAPAELRARAKNLLGYHTDHDTVSSLSSTTRGHDSDCAVHNAPAYPPGPCDCSLSSTHGKTT